MRIVLAFVIFAATGVQVPTELAKFRSWPTLVKSPHGVPLKLYIQCMAPTQGQWDAAQKTYGPHAKKFVQYYANDVAAKAFAAKQKLPKGSVIAKEKRGASEHGVTEGVAFMVKRDTSEFRGSGGWEFLYFPASSDQKATQRACASCHEGAKTTDYVFGSYPRDH